MQPSVLKMSDTNFDEIFTKYVGGHGRYQLINAFCIATIYHIGLMPVFTHVFTAFQPNHRCLVPECEAEGTNFSRVRN